MLSIILILVGLLLWAAALYVVFREKPAVDPVEPEEPKDYPLSVYPKYPIEVISRSSQISVSINDPSNHGWTVEVPSWITVDTDIAIGNKSILLTIKKNSGKNARTADVVITDTKTGAVYTIPVTQKAKSSDNPQVSLTISSGLYMTNTENNYDLIWDIREGNDDAGDPLFDGQLGYPCRSGSSYTWGDNQWSELVPESEWGTRKVIHYELAVVDYDNNGNAYQVLTGTAEVEIPADPDGVENIAIELPSFGI